MRIATDIGGTFTDLVAVKKDGTLLTLKGDTTPPHFEQGVIEALQKSGLDPTESTRFLHGTTTIINALTERTGAKTGLITTHGFRDVLELARGNRPDLFNMVFKKPVPFVPRYLRCEVQERVDSAGNVILPLSESDVEKAVTYFKEQGVEAIAVSFINSYTNDAHELQTVELVKKLWPEVFVSSSGDVTREWREYERTSTVALNAYVGPIATSYIDELDQHLQEINLGGKKYIMQSNGGTTSFDAAKKAPINLVESGPVAGVFGAAVLGKALGEENLIAFDVGGTTAKCSLIDAGDVKITTSYHIERDDYNAGYPIMAPVVDIVEIGNGGGSIAWMDEVGSLKVGPRSAGAVPGPVAYGKGGTQPTTTDACLVAGHISKDSLDSDVDMAAVENALLEHVGKPLGVDAKHAATDVIRVAEANMYNALKLVSVRRGYDPRDFALLAFGGGGPMHAASLAKELAVKKVIVPVAAAVFSAWGMLMTDVRQDYIQTNIKQLHQVTDDELQTMWGGLLDRANREFKQQGIAEADFTLSYFADMRYSGQEHTVKISVPKPPWNQAVRQQIEEAFHNAHEHSYTFRLPDTAVEIVNLHLAGYGQGGTAELPHYETDSTTVEDAFSHKRQVYFTFDGWLEAAVYNRDKLPVETPFEGPCVVEEKTGTILVHPGQTAHVDKYGNLIILLEDE